MTAAHKLWMTACVALLLGCLGMRSQRDQARAALSEHRAQVADATAKAEAAAREKETMLLATTVALSDKLNQEKSRAQETQTRLVADIRSGTQRLSIAAHCPAPAGLAPTDPAPATGAADTTRAELDRSAAEALVTIAADGDAAIRERNACIALYNSARDTLNGN